MVKTKIEVRFSFLAVLSVILCTDTEGTALQCLLACALHETGHIITMLFHGTGPEKIVFGSGGIRLKGKNEKSLPVIISGCLVNFTLFGFFYFLCNDYRLKLFGMINLLTGLFNLAPIHPLDGYNLIEMLFIRLMPAEKVGNVLKIAEIIACIVFAPVIIIFLFNGRVNFSLVIFLFYLFVVDIIENL